MHLMLLFEVPQTVWWILGQPLSRRWNGDFMLSRFPTCGQLGQTQALDFGEALRVPLHLMPFGWFCEVSISYWPR